MWTLTGLLSTTLVLFTCKSIYCWLFNCDIRPKHGGNLIILRGLPGSGKTEYIKDYLKRHKITDYQICSANDYFIRDKKYKFNPRELPVAHNNCLCEVVNSMSRRIGCVVVNNPNSQQWEYEHYEILAKHFNYEVYIIEIDCPTEEHVEYFQQRCTYKIPKEICLSMRNRWEKDDVCLKTPYAPDLAESSESDSENWSGSDSSVNSEDDDKDVDDDRSKLKKLHILLTNMSEANSVEGYEDNTELLSDNYPGDSLPYPKKTQKELDEQLDSIVANRTRFRRRVVRRRIV